MAVLEFVDLLVGFLLGVSHRLTDPVPPFVCLVGCGVLVRLLHFFSRVFGLIGTRTAVLSGNPDSRHISTSFVERQNLTTRMSNRRFTRLTNGFSKKLENHRHSVALHYAYYNFCRVHQTLRVTPAMEAGLSDHVWDVEELVGLLEA